MTSSYPITVTRIVLASLVVALAAPAVALGGSPAGKPVVDLRSPDTVEATRSVRVLVVDVRSPDTIEATLSPAPLSLAGSSGFDWGDAAIGAGLASTLLTLVAGSMLFWLRRHPRQSVRSA